MSGDIAPTTRTVRRVGKAVVVSSRNGINELAIKPGDPVPTDRVAKAVFVTPALAQDWLDRYSDPLKRHVRPHKVEDYRTKMDAGEWAEMTQPIGFTYVGSLTALYDGHHRLKALVKSSLKGLWFEVHFGQDIQARRIEGVRLTRSPGDMLRMEGCFQYVTETAAGVRVVMLHDQTVGTDTRWRNSMVNMPDPEDIVLQWLDDPTLWASVTPISKGLMNSWPTGMAQGAVGGFLFLAEKAHPGQGATFLRLASAGQGPVDGRSRSVLSIFLQTLKIKPIIKATVRSGTQKDWDRYTLAVLIRAFNAWLVGKPDFQRPEWNGPKPFFLDRMR